MGETRNHEDIWKWKHSVLDAAKVVVRGKFIAICTYFKRQKKLPNNLILNLMEQEKEQTWPKASRKKVIVKIRTEIEELETKNRTDQYTKAASLKSSTN